MTTVAVIPARYESSRFPGKPLANQTGKYLIQHVVEQVTNARSIDRVIVATDDVRIQNAVESFGGQAVMTSPDHQSGTDRVAEVAQTLDPQATIIVNVQGDEPEIRPDAIDTLVAKLVDNAETDMATLACPFGRDDDPTDPNCVKVVCDNAGRALYFSRSLVPYPRDDAGNPADPGQWLLHLGIYAYRRDFLMTFASWPPSRLEQIERLEQLRVLEQGGTLGVGIVDQAAPGIDTPEEYAAFVQRMTQQ